jgi:hypothetical protein
MQCKCQDASLTPGVLHNISIIIITSNVNMRIHGTCKIIIKIIRCICMMYLRRGAMISQCSALHLCSAEVLILFSQFPEVQNIPIHAVHQENTNIHRLHFIPGAAEQCSGSFFSSPVDKYTQQQIFNCPRDGKLDELMCMLIAVEYNKPT